MNRGLLALVTALAAVSIGACTITEGSDDDGIGGGGGIAGGAGGTGGSGATGGTGGSGAGGSGAGGSGAGGSVGECVTAADCDAPIRDCAVAICDGGVCGSDPFEAGAACSLASGDGVCDGVGNCVECNTSDDCAANEECDENLDCVSVTPPNNSCANNFCEVEPATADCLECIQESFTGPCQDEYEACDADCLAFFDGTGGSFNDPQVQALGDCICTSGVCVE